MEKNKFNVPFPEEAVIAKEIDQIIAQGLDQKVSVFKAMKLMYQQIGLRQIFLDRVEVMAILMVVGLGVSLFFYAAHDYFSLDLEGLYQTIFLVSPILFFSLSVYSYMNKINNHTFEVEMVCKYNVHQILAYRMLVTSVGSIVMNMLLIVGLIMLQNQIEFMRAFMISNTGLFLFSVLFLYVVTKKQGIFLSMLTIIFWLGMNLLLTLLAGNFYQQLLLQMPLFVYGFVLFVCLILYLHYLKQIFHLRYQEG